LTALANVGAAASDDDLADRVTAPRARFALAQVDQETVLKRPPGTVDVAEVVDRGSLGLDPGLKRLLDSLP
jgi:hypothetical protein